MKNYSIYGIALIIGSLGAIVTMIFHPTGHNFLGQPDDIARRNEMITVATHSLALFSLPILFYGFLGFSRRLGLDHPLVSAATVSYGFALLGGMCAAVINGLVAPIITRQILTADESTKPLLNMILMNNSLLNQAFTKVFVVASSLAIIFWSVRIIKINSFAKIIAVSGILLSIIGLFGLFSGHLRLDVHGFGLLIFGQTAWTIIIAVFLLRFKPMEQTD